MGANCWCIFGIILCVCLIAIIVLVGVYLKMNRDTQSALLSMNQYNINIQAIIDETIPSLLDKIIEECFTDYKVMILFPRNEGYLSDEREKEIRSDLIAKVSERISPIAMDRLSLWYNKERMAEVMGDKIYISVMNYVINHNTDLMKQQPFPPTKEV